MQIRIDSSAPSSNRSMAPESPGRSACLSVFFREEKRENRRILSGKGPLPRTGSNALNTTPASWWRKKSLPLQRKNRKGTYLYPHRMKWNEACRKQCGKNPQHTYGSCTEKQSGADKDVRKRMRKRKPACLQMVFLYKDRILPEGTKRNKGGFFTKDLKER